MIPIAWEPYIGAAKAFAFVAILLGIFYFGHRTGAQGVQAEWNAEKAQQAIASNKAVFDRIKQNEHMAEQQELDNQNLKKGYDNEIAAVRADTHPRRLRIDSTACAGLASTAKAEGSSGSHEAVAGTIALPEQVERDLRAVMREADEIVASCRVAQQFIQENGFAP